MSEWKTYRTRFLIKAKQLTEPLFFTDPLGREHHGDVGDYLVESSDGLRRIAPRIIFEDVYVAMDPVDPPKPSHDRRRPALLQSVRRGPPPTFLLGSDRNGRSVENRPALAHPAR